ncbi:MAG: efflux RND transporter periplasmic adaptor subunit [Bacteroidia bacterium]
MKQRQIIIVVGIAFLLLGVFGMRYLSSLKKTSERKSPPPAVRSIEYITVKNDTLRASIPVTGKAVAKDRIEIYAEVSGNLQKSSDKFKVGNDFKAGQVLISIDNSEMSLSLQSAKSNFLSVLTRILPDLKLDYPNAFSAWQTYTENFSVKSPMVQIPESNGKEKYFLSTQGVLNQYYTIKSQEARLAKYTITAPYTGTVAESFVNPGTLVRAGQKLGSFIKKGVFEIEFAIDLSHLPYVAVGSEVVLASNQISGDFKGKVIRISDALDANTQSAKVIVQVDDKRLKEGMYLSGNILTEPFNNVFMLSKGMVNSNSETFVIVNNQLKAIKIKPLFVGENELVTNQLKDGDRVMKTLFDGANTGIRVSIKSDDNQGKSSSNQ